MKLHRLFFVFLLSFLLFLTPLGRSQVSSDPNECEELETDYSRQCWADTTRCGAFCFYPICWACEPESHQNHGEHEHCSGGDGPDDPEDCDTHQDHGTHKFHKSPCIDWTWHLYDPEHGRDLRADEYDVPHLSDSMELGLPPEGYSPPESSCVTEMDTREILPGSLSPVTSSLTDPGPLSPELSRFPRGERPGFEILSGQGSSSEPVGVENLSHLPRTPGAPGAPLLDSVTEVEDRSMLLAVSGGPSGRGVKRQYRYWSYNGLLEVLEDGLTRVEVAPTEFRVPFEDFPSGGQRVAIPDEMRGIISFQVRAMEGEDEPSGWSNIVHQMVGMGNLFTVGSRRETLEYEIPLPTVPAWGTPLPPLEEDAERPVRPSIHSLSQVSGVPSTVEVVLSEEYEDDVEHRWWPHSGFLPTVQYDHWHPAPAFIVPPDTDTDTEPPPGSVFRVSELTAGDVDLEALGVDGETPRAWVFNFQIRLVDVDGIPGDPSDVVAVRVWDRDFAASNYVSTIPGATLPEDFANIGPVPPPAPPAEEPEDSFPCSRGRSEDAAAGLLRDCRLLMEAREVLYGADALNWDWELAVDEWEGVTLDGDPKRVQGLSLNDRELLGPVPWSLGRLSELRTLELRGNSLLSLIPSSLGYLHHLEVLDLQGNRLVDHVPVEFSRLVHLHTLRLDGNDLTGALTQGQLDRMTSLKTLGLSDNSFHGSIPPALSGFPLQFLRLGGNSWGGCLLADLKEVADHDLDRLSGLVPDC